MGSSGNGLDSATFDVERMALGRPASPFGAVQDALRDNARKARERHHVPYSRSPVRLEPPPRPNRAEYPFASTIRMQGFVIGVENPKGSTRRGTNPDGTPWATRMRAHYGEFLEPDTRGADDDPLDVFVGPNADSPVVVVVHQRDPVTKRPDEDKVMLGFDSVDEALQAYRAHYDRSGFYGGHSHFHVGEFWRWLHTRAQSGRMLRKARSPFGDALGAVLRSEGWVELGEREGARLWAEQARIVKAGGRPHKYIRRVPKPGGGYRYYYSETSTAHAATEGERVNLRDKGLVDVTKVRGDRIEVRDVKTGETREISFAELNQQLADAYRERYARGADRLARRFIAQVKAVKAKTSDPAELAQAFAERFKAAKVDPDHAQRLVGFLAPRKGWDEDAKRALLAMASDARLGRRIAPLGRQIATGAENLRNADGAETVQPSHVGEATLLRVDPEQDDQSARIAGLQAHARIELASIRGALGALEAAGSNAAARAAITEYATAAARFEAVHELERMAEAYPGLRDLPELAQAREVRAKLDALTAERTGRRGQEGLGVAGSSTTVFVADGEGRPTPQRARYRLVEAADVIASHDPTRSFRKRSDYPEGVQERAYHRDTAEQDKVRGNAQKLRPEYVVNTNPDAVNGPPIITDKGVVLGGNSRAMSLQLAYGADGSGDKGTEYRAHLRDNAHAFGLTPGEVDGMTAPVLVREVETPDTSQQALGVLVRRYNESFTQGMDPRTDQVARGRLVSQGMLDMLSRGLDRRGSDGQPMHATLNAYLSSSDGRHFVRELGASSADGAGIIDRRNRSQYIGRDGKLNEDGKTFVERVLVGHVVPDADLLGNMLPSQVQAIARSVPHIVRAAGHGHDIRKPLRDALEAHVYMRQHNLSSLSEYERSQTLADVDAEAGFQGKPELDEVSKGILDVLIRRSGPVQMSAFFRDFAEQAAHNSGGGTNLFGESMDTAAVLRSTTARSSGRVAASSAPGALQKTTEGSMGPFTRALVAAGFAKAGGEGSRGGKIIGHTRSGKPIYAKHSHPAHRGFTADDHRDAFHAHAAKHEAKAGDWSNDKGLAAAEHHGREAMKHAESANMHGLDPARERVKSLPFIVRYRQTSPGVRKAGGGEGSRGGRVIGHTKSGKPIYAVSGMSIHGPSERNDYSAADHHDAAKKHLRESTGVHDTGEKAHHETEARVHLYHAGRKSGSDHRKALGGAHEQMAEHHKAHRDDAPKGSRAHKWHSEGHDMHRAEAAKHRGGSR